MNDLETNGNLIEAGLWLAVSLTLGIQAARASGRLRRIFGILAAAFLAFGISDLIESRTGAWWRPVWLLILKATCVAVIIHGFHTYYRLRKEGRKS